MRSRVAALLLTCVLLAACGGGRSQSNLSPAPEPEVSGGLLVFAAASLTDAFEEVATAFEQRHPGTPVTLNFGPSTGLADQIIQGAPADVFASANMTQMEEVTAAGAPQVFARNLLEIAVEPGNPLGVRGLADLERSDVTLVLAASEVPAGELARQALANAGVQANPASEEVDVRAVLQKVALGEADAGIVYVTDVRAADAEVDGVPIPSDQNLAATYPIAAVAEAPNPEAARAFVAFVVGLEGQEILARHGFARP